MLQLHGHAHLCKEGKERQTHSEGSRSCYCRSFQDPFTGAVNETFETPYTKAQTVGGRKVLGFPVIRRIGEQLQFYLLLC